MPLPSAKSALEALPPGRHHDGSGLYLQVRRSERTGQVNRAWLLRFMIGGRSRDMGLGPYPAVGLAKAREKAREHRETLKGDRADPLEVRRARAREERLAAAKRLTFRQVAEQYIAAKEAEWTNDKHRWQWTHSLGQFAFPVIGDLHVADIDTPQVLLVLNPLWHTKTDTAAKLRGRLEAVLDYATVSELRQGANPARWKGHLAYLLPKPRKVAPVQHHPALPYGQVAAFYAALVAHLEKHPGMGGMALRWCILTVCRTGDVTGTKPKKPGAMWGHMDLEVRVWTIPSTKTGQEHRVPLSDAAMAMLGELPGPERGDYVFPGQSVGRSITHKTIDLALQSMPGTWRDKHGEPITIHGFRSTFRDWVAECTNHPRELAEAALAHKLSNATEAAYQRGDLLEKRRDLMEAWGRYCTGEGAAKAVPLRKAHTDA